MFLKRIAKSVQRLFSDSKESEKKRRSAQRFRPKVEELERRLVPAATVNNWTDLMKDGLWSDAQDWSQRHVPTQNEIATFTAAKIDDVTLSADTTVYGLDVQTGYTGKINLSAATVEVTNTMTLADPKSTILFNQLRFDGQNDGTVTSTPFTWTGGFLTANAIDQVFMIAPNAKVVLGDAQTNNDETLTGGAIYNYGSASWQGLGNIVLNNGAQWDNQSGSTFTVVATPQFTPNVQNQTANELFTVDAGATLTDNVGVHFHTSVNIDGTYTIQQPVSVLMEGEETVTGTVNVPLGARVQVSNGQITLNGANFAGNGAVTLTPAASAIVQGNSTVSNFNQTSSAVSGTGTLTLTGNSNAWQFGVWNGTGQVIVAPNASLNTAGADSMTGGWSLVNNGTITQPLNGGMTVDGGTSITNNGTFNTVASVLYSGNGGPAGTFTNNGTFLMTGAGTSKIGLAFSNAGTLQINSGTLEVIQDVTQTAGKTFLNGGNLRVDGGIGFTITGGTLYGGGNIMAATVDNGGSIDETQVAAYTTLSITGAYKQEANGMLLLKMGRAQNGALQFDKLTVTGQANLGGGLAIMGGVQGQAGDNADILDYGSAVNDFDPMKVMLPPGFTKHKNVQQYNLTSP